MSTAAAGERTQRLDARPRADAAIRIGGAQAQVVGAGRRLGHGQCRLADALVDQQVGETRVARQLHVVNLPGAAGPGQPQVLVVADDAGRAGRAAHDQQPAVAPRPRLAGGAQAGDAPLVAARRQARLGGQGVDVALDAWPGERRLVGNLQAVAGRFGTAAPGQRRAVGVDGRRRHRAGPQLEGAGRIEAFEAGLVDGPHAQPPDTVRQIGETRRRRRKHPVGDDVGETLVAGDLGAVGTRLVHRRERQLHRDPLETRRHAIEGRRREQRSQRRNRFAGAGDHAETGGQRLGGLAAGRAHPHLAAGHLGLGGLAGRIRTDPEFGAAHRHRGGRGADLVARRRPALGRDARLDPPVLEEELGILAVEPPQAVHLLQARGALRLHRQARLVGHQQGHEGRLAGPQQGAGGHLRVEQQGAAIRGDIALQRDHARHPRLDPQPGLRNAQLRPHRQPQRIGQAIVQAERLPAERRGEELFLEADQRIAGARRVGQLETGGAGHARGQHACHEAEGTEEMTNH